jgi:hypothetical protein
MAGTNPINIPGAVPQPVSIDVPDTPTNRVVKAIQKQRRDANINGAVLRGALARAKWPLTKEQFLELTALDPGRTTDRFWYLFSGGKQIDSLARLADCLENCGRTTAMSGDSMMTLAYTKNLIPVSTRDLGQSLRRMNLQELGARAFADNNNLRELLDQAKAMSRDDRGKEGFNNLSDETYELMAFALIRQFSDAAWQHGLNDVTELDLRDQWVLARFQPTFRDFVLQGGINGHTEGQIDELLVFQEKVYDFRKWSAKNEIQTRVEVSGVDPYSQRGEINDVLKTYKQLGPDEVVNRLNALGRATRGDIPVGPVGPKDANSTLGAGLGYEITQK